MVEADPNEPSGVLRRLRDAGLRPRHALGQNFLHDPRLLESIVDEAGFTPGEAAFEVGTGPGTLTRRLAARAERVLSVEIDARLAEFARGELAGLANVDVLVADVLEGKSRLAPEVLERLRALGPFRWVSNLPYAVATPTVLTFLEAGLDWRRCVLTLQLEVAERWTAAPGEPAYGGATILAGFWAEARIARRIGAGTFWPRPKVESAVLVLSPRDPAPRRELWPDFRGWVRELFLARRKKIRGALSRRLGERADEALGRLGRTGDERAEELTAADFALLAQNYPGF